MFLSELIFSKLCSGISKLHLISPTKHHLLKLEFDRMITKHIYVIMNHVVSSNQRKQKLQNWAELFSDRMLHTILILREYYIHMYES